MISPPSATAPPNRPARLATWVLAAGLLALSLWAAWPRAPEAVVVAASRGVAPAVAAAVRADLGRFYRLPTRTAAPPAELPRTPAGQVDASRLLDALAAQPLARGERLVLLCDQDGTSPGLNYVFGLAQRAGRVAVVFLPRLCGNAPPAVAAERVRKVTRHELGHVFGLDHCDTSTCVMAFANNAVALGVTSTELCPTCARRLARWRWALRPRR